MKNLNLAIRIIKKETTPIIEAYILYNKKFKRLSDKNKLLQIAYDLQINEYKKLVQKLANEVIVSFETYEAFKEKLYKILYSLPVKREQLFEEFEEIIYVLESKYQEYK